MPQAYDESEASSNRDPLTAVNPTITSSSIPRVSEANFALTPEIKCLSPDESGDQRTEDESFHITERPAKRQRRLASVKIRPPELVYPKSSYYGSERPSPAYPEEAVLRDLLVRFPQDFKSGS